MDNIQKQDKEKPEVILEQLAKARQELSTLYEISNAMHKTLELEEILFIILTGVTSHTGLGFNRAMLLLPDVSGVFLEGKLGIGPDNGEEAKRIWGLVDEQEMDLDDLVNSYAHFKANGSPSRFLNLVRGLRIPVQEPDGGIVARAFGEGMPLHIKKDNRGDFPNDPLFSVFSSEEFVVTPLRAKDKSIGLIVADNIFTRRTITKDDIRVLVMFANQAGMAIENSQLYEQTLVRAHKDSLTDLWNHGYFQIIFDDRLKQAREGLSFLSLIMLDIDNFKNYNDTWGHQKGDEILLKISRIIVDSSRKIDTVCRYGGEEFAVILPEASRKDASAVAERIRASVEAFPFIQEPDRPTQKITVSIGVASFPEDGHQKSDLILAADLALYEAKRGGKNRIVCYSPSLKK